MRLKPLGLFTIGALVVLFGALLKILKVPYSQPLLIIGLLTELFGLVFYIYRYQIKKMKG